MKISSNSSIVKSDGSNKCLFFNIKFHSFLTSLC
nr:MAG TPA_asm: hypothetical protein [Caudoviricetes sp.]